MDSNVNLQETIKIRNAMSDYRDKVYLNMIRQIKEKTNELLKDDLGSQFVYSCGRDLAGELVRTYFDTSDYNITVDQLATRILKFNYENEYDPLANSLELQKNVYNYADISSSTLDQITKDLDSNQEKLFTKEDVWNDKKQKYESKYEDRKMIDQGKKKYYESIQNEDGNANDEYTGKEGEYITDKNGRQIRRLQVDHSDPLATATYNQKFLTQKGVEELKVVLNSEDNFAMMDATANGSKNDAKVYDKHGNDITHKATAEQKTDVICKRWEKTKGTTRKKLVDAGYLNEDGTVPKAVRKKLEDNIRHSQNAQSKVILKNTKYGTVAKDAAKVSFTKANIGKMIAGQVIYYAAPPIIYEVRCIIQKKDMTLDNAMNKLTAAGKRIGEYVYLHLKGIFKSIASNSLKKFIKSFMDILIGMVKATVKKLLKVVKSLVMAVVDSVRIIAMPESTPAQKADSVFNLFGITVTNIVIELLFEAIEKGANIPEFLLKPLQIVTSVVCTNFTMLILQKADVFDVRLGFKIDAIKKVFAEAKESYDLQMEYAKQYTSDCVNEILLAAKEECMYIYKDLISLDTKKQSVRNSVEKISTMFNMSIDFEESWLNYLGVNVL